MTVRGRLHQPNFLPPPDRCTGDALIEIAGVGKSFKNAAGEFHALKSVTACFYPGEFISVVGKSGSGKSTLVNMITGIDHPTTGTVRVGGCYVHKLSENDMSVWRGANLGIVFQFFQLLPTLSLLENVMLPMYLANRYAPAERETRALDLLRRMGLESVADKPPAAVSGGQQQEAAIARALANDPPILIADEPTGNLDSKTADEVFELFSGLIESGKTILMVTHDIGLARRTTRTLLISDGEIINPYAAGGLHHLTHAQLLWLTHHLRPRAAGAPLPRLAPGGAGLYLVTGGILEGFTPGGEVIARLGPGQFASAVDSSLALLDWRPGGDEPLELLSVDYAEFSTWAGADPALTRALLAVEPPQKVGAQ